MKYWIVLHGCDAETEIPIELTRREVELIEKISKLSKQYSEYPCMPTLNLNTMSEKQYLGETDEEEN